MLTDIQCRKAKAAAKPFKLTDSGGLHLFVTPAGGKHWRYRYEIDGREKLLSIGPYPAVSLTDARVARDDAKAAQRSGRDPNVAKRLERANVAKGDSETFKALAELWHSKNKSRWAAVHAADVLNSLQRDVFPEIGPLPIREITIPVVLALLNKIEARGAIETAHRVRQRMSSVFLFAIASGAADSDPAHVVKGALLPVDKTRRQPAITDLGEARTMLSKAEVEPAHAVTKLALRLLALVPVRPGVIAATPWAEFDDIKNNIWCVPAVRMKLKLDKKKDATFDHLVALPEQALDVIAVLRTITGSGPLAFPNTRHGHKPMSENAIGYLLNRAGYHSKHVPHGWRSTFSTVMNERYKADHDVIELMLAHVPENKTAAAYNRAEHLARRKELAQIWADLILKGAKPAASLLDGPRR